jgi:phosphomethylpyrimidine synthase
MTQLEDAKKGTITDAVKRVADDEGFSPEKIREGVAEGLIVIPKNIGRDFDVKAIGKGLKTKVNANLGSSPSHCDLNEELAKLEAAVDSGADAVMDLSTGGDLSRTLSKIIEKSPVMVGTVPIYSTICRISSKGKEYKDMTADDLFQEIENHAKAGVDFVTVHCGITRQSLETLNTCGRIMGIVSRGGSLLAEWISKNQQENPLYKQYDRLLDLAREYDVTLSLGDGLRPGAIEDAEDRAQTAELIILGDLARRARHAGVQVMIEGPGHVPLGRIAGDMKLQKRLCDEAPYYVLGPLPTDIAPGYDHIVGAIGGAIAAANGADFLCYVTPAEHLCLPGVQDVREGVLASRIAAHIGDLEKGVKGARKRNRDMSLARCNFDWEGMFALALDPDKARERRLGSEDKDRDVCTMCGDLCAMKTYKRSIST